MDLLKAKIYLDKINRDFSRMTKDPENIVRIDVDIILAYVRELYDAFLEERAAAPATPVSTKTEAPPRRPAPTTTVRVPEPALAAPPPEQAPAPEPPPSRSPEPVMPPPMPEMEERPAPAPPPPPPPPAPEPEPEPVRSVFAPPVERAPVYAQVPPEAEALFEQKEARELSEKLSEMPIADLRKAIALNDRLLLTRELFGNDAHAFEAAIGALNSFSSMEQAKNYLLDHCVMRFGWTSKKHMETAKGFIRLVRRRYK